VNYQTQPTIKVIDSIMGSGKTTYIIDQLKKEKDRSKRFLIVTPYLKEIERLDKEIPRLSFKSPKEGDLNASTKAKKKSKSGELLKLIESDHNILITHSLFGMVPASTLMLLATKGYEVIIDEAFECVRQYGSGNGERSGYDLSTLLRNKVVTENDDGYLEWKDDGRVDRKGMFNQLKQDCDNRRIRVKPTAGTQTNKQTDMFFWELPIDQLKAFKSITILTYMFDASVMHAYFRCYSIDWQHLSLTSDLRLVNWDSDIEATQAKSVAKYLYVLMGGKLNDTGEELNSYSSSWLKSRTPAQLAEIERAARNVLQNIFGARGSTTMWSCVKAHLANLTPRGFKGAFVACNVRATNDYKDKVHLAYLRNIYSQPPVVQYFKAKGVTVNQDRYALSELLQWIFRSAIREQKDVKLYLPSKRMRKLLHEWSGGLCKV
jgi:hypothetical protein